MNTINNGRNRLAHFWCANEFDELVSMITKVRAKEVEELLAQAEDLLKNSFVFREHWEMERTNQPVIFEDKIDWEYVPEKDPEWTFAMNRHTFLLILAKAWRLTGDLRYGQKYMELASDFINRQPLTDQRKKTSWRSIETGIRCENWLRSMQLMSDCPVMTEELWKQMEESLKLHGHYLAETQETFHRISNWGVLQNHGLFLLGLYFNYEEWIKTAINRLNHSMHIQVFHDGTQWEQSPMYHGEVLHCFLDTFLHTKRFHITMEEEFEDKLHKMVYALAVWRRPDGEIPCQSDSDGIEAGDLVAIGSFLFGDECLKYLSGSNYCSEVWWLLGSHSMKEYLSMPMKKPEFTSFALTDSGNYILRDGFEEQDGYIRFHCGTMGSGHGHADLLHVDFMTEGEEILIDSGRYTYLDGEVRNYLKSPAAHNTVLVDGVDFTECITSWGYGKMATPVKGEYCFTKTADYVWGAHLGYLDRGLYSERKVIYLKKKLLCIIDSFRGTGQHDYKQYWHFGKSCTVTLQENKGIISGEKIDGEILCLKGEGEIKKDICSKEYNCLENNDTLVQNWRALGNTSMITMISADKKGQKKSMEAKLIPVTLRSSGQELDATQAEAIRILYEGEEFVVILCHEEIINGVNLVSAGDYSSYGKVLLFTRDMPFGQCLQY